MSGEACDKDCSAEAKKKEVAADYSKCVCPGTKDGASFADLDACDACATDYYPKGTCTTKCDATKLEFLDKDDKCAKCGDKQYFKADTKVCTDCGDTGVPTANGKDCECPKGSEFKEAKKCGSTDECKDGYVPKGTCTTKCTAT